MKTFNNLGPVEVDEEDFLDYKNSDSPTLNTLLHGWMDERSNSDGVRRLMLRDLLRQTINRSNPYLNFETRSLGLKDLVYMDKGQSKTLYWTLHNRPKLLAEFQSELLYNLENSIPPFDPNHNTYNYHASEYIEFLLPLLDEQQGRELFRHLPVHAGETTSFRNDISINPISVYLRLWDPESKMPEWLRRESWEMIDKSVTKEALSLYEKNESPPTPSIDTLKNFIRPNSNMNAITSIISLLERLPETIMYVPLFRAAELSMKLEDTFVSYIFARRHLVNHFNLKGPTETHQALYLFSKINPPVTNFLLWMIGIATVEAIDETRAEEVISIAKNLLCLHEAE